ncbi:hypothetical protein [Mycoplasma leonicaptivi]|uniref:hypothetical protein n=1 Tax=Mycoplasma leonicaptivi TaxID=36742 RepID=UPI000B302769|nr:hypothetical protein [Mycoplasma leonicaptivi]
MNQQDKKSLSEADVKRLLITPAIYNKNWKENEITMETKITDGKINNNGNVVSREKIKFADYILYISNPSKPIAVIEAKKNELSPCYGLNQSKRIC